MRFDSTVSHLLLRVATAHKNHVEKRLADLGLHTGQAAVLIELWRKDGPRQIDLANQLGVAAPTINKILSGLIDSGAVTRRRIEDDARSTRIYLTETGREVQALLEDLWFEIEEEILTEFTETERLVLSELLTKLKHFYFNTEPEE
jgi:MarR family transcriptional regulator, organic hydroperoxide resistance regulator